MTKRRKDAKPKESPAPTAIEAVPEPEIIADPPAPDLSPPEPAESPTLGIMCPKCECRHFEVIYTTRKTHSIVRRRECRHCGYRITTREQIQGFRPLPVE